MVMKAFVRHARWFALAALVMGLATEYPLRNPLKAGLPHD